MLSHFDIASAFANIGTSTLIRQVLVTKFSRLGVFLNPECLDDDMISLIFKEVLKLFYSLNK